MASRVGCCVLFALLVSGCTTPGTDQKPIMRELGKLTPPMHLLSPARSNWGPGFVFHGKVSKGRIVEVTEVCQTLYDHARNPATGAEVTLANLESSRSANIKASVDLLKEVIGSDNSAKIGIEGIGGGTKLSIDWGPTKIHSLALEDGYLDDGSPRPINPRCRAAIEDLKAKNKFTGQTFLITTSLAPETLKYTFEKTGDADASADLSLAEILTANAGVDWKVTGNTTLEISKPLNIAYGRPVLLTEYTPSGLVGGNLVTIKGQPTNYSVEQ